MIAQPAGVHSNHCVSTLSIRLLSFFKKAHNSRTKWFILIKFCIRMHVNIVQPLACETAFWGGRDIAEHHLGC